MFIIFLNGPPGCGKDTIAEYVSKKYEISHLTFKDKLIEATTRFFSISDDTWKTLYKNKEIPSHKLNINNKHLSPRQALIHVAEAVIKPVFGKDIFAKSLYNEIKNKEERKEENEENQYTKGIYIISDLGFMDEFKIFEDKNKCENTMEDYIYCLIKISRNECNFNNDSRQYININRYGELCDEEGNVKVKELNLNSEYFIYNNDALEDLYRKIDEIIKNCMDIYYIQNIQK